MNRHLRHRALVDWLGVPDVAATAPPFPEGDNGPVAAFTAELDHEPRPWILAWPGSSRTGSHKRWQPERLREAVRGIRDRTGGTVLVGWGPEEEEEARELAAGIPGARAIPSLTLPELALLLARCDLYVGMDTGPMHVAALLGIPTVGVFGRSDPMIHGPARHLRARVVSGPDAREWGTRARRGLPPFEEPDPREVVEAAVQLLAEGGSASRDESEGRDG